MYSVNLVKLELHFSEWFWVRVGHREISMSFREQKCSRSHCGCRASGSGQVMYILLISWPTASPVPAASPASDSLNPEQRCSSTARVPTSSLGHCSFAVPAVGDRWMQQFVPVSSSLLSWLLLCPFLLSSILHPAFLMCLFITCPADILQACSDAEAKAFHRLLYQLPLMGPG